MGGGTFQAFSTAVSGMQTYQLALNTTAHNIANVGTKGYSKQTVNQVAMTAGGASTTITGSGVSVTDVTITRSDYYDIKYRNTNALASSYETKSYYLQCMETYIYASDSDVGGITNSFDDFFKTLSGLSSDVTSETLQNQAVTYASTFAGYINDLADGMQTLQKEANAEIKTTVDKINAVAKEVASLTKQINTLESYGGTANDLRDQRNILIDELSTYVGVEVIERPPADGVGFNQYVVYINGALLLDGDNTRQLVLTQRENKKNINDVGGLYEISWSTGDKFPTDVVGNPGTLQALFTIRDGNNAEALKGDLTSLTVNAEGKSVVTLEGANINDCNKLNIPASDGVITICGVEYTYESFDVSVGADGKYTYSFTLKKSMSAEQQASIQNVIARGATSTVGSDVDFKGIPYIMAQLNEFVRTFSEQFNTVQNAGYDYYRNQGIDFFNATNIVDGANYVFNEKVDGKDASFSSLAQKDASGNYIGSYYYMTCLNFCVTQALVEDPKKIASSSDPLSGAGHGNNENMRLLADVKNNAKMFTHGAPDSFMQSLTSTIGVESKKAQSISKSQANILYSVENRRLSVSGVDEDEEGRDLIKFQSLLKNQYKVLSVMNEILNKLINDTGVS